MPSYKDFSKHSPHEGVQVTRVCCLFYTRRAHSAFVSATPETENVKPWHLQRRRSLRVRRCTYPRLDATIPQIEDTATDEKLEHLPVPCFCKFYVIMHFSLGSANCIRHADEIMHQHTLLYAVLFCVSQPLRQHLHARAHLAVYGFASCRPA